MNLQPDARPELCEGGPLPVWPGARSASEWEHSDGVMITLMITRDRAHTGTNCLIGILCSLSGCLRGPRDTDNHGTNTERAMGSQLSGRGREAININTEVLIVGIQ